MHTRKLLLYIYIYRISGLSKFHNFLTIFFYTYKKFYDCISLKNCFISCNFRRRMEVYFCFSVELYIPFVFETRESTRMLSFRAFMPINNLAWTAFVYLPALVYTQFRWIFQCTNKHRCICAHASWKQTGECIDRGA